MSNIDIDKTDLNLLKSLQALLTERHVGKAAKRMHIGQSAMSHTLARLRDTFGDPLFVRTAKGLEPTTRALGLATQLSAVLDDISALLAPESFEPARIKTRFRVHTHSFIIAGYLPGFFRSVHLQAPKLIFDTHALSEFSYQQLDQGNVDLIIAAGLQAPSRFMQRRIVEEGRVCLVDKKHPARRNWNLESFLQYPHLRNTLVDDKDDPVAEALRKRKLPARQIGFYADDMLAQAIVLKDSELIATLPRSLAETGRKQYGHVVLPCPVDVSNVIIKAIWHERSQNDQTHSWLREQLGAVP